ncbi:MAG: SymE family type I addiction module toxin [Lachnospiraceae bacterium]|nr:SymE family type I addiction module toxin [Lachnospiraceae bacterium]
MKERTLKVRTIYRAEAESRREHITGFRTIPEIILMGDWLKKAGFNEEDKVTVRYGNGRLTIKKRDLID